MFRIQGILAVVLGLSLSVLGDADSFAAGNPNGGSRPTGAGRPTGSRPAFSALLTAFDRNRDSQLSRGEVPAAVWNRLRAADTNNDSIVTQSEYDASSR